MGRISTKKATSSIDFQSPTGPLLNLIPLEDDEMLIFHARFQFTTSINCWQDVVDCSLFVTMSERERRTGSAHREWTQLAAIAYSILLHLVQINCRHRNNPLQINTIGMTANQVGSTGIELQEVVNLRFTDKWR